MSSPESERLVAVSGCRYPQPLLGQLCASRLQGSFRIPASQMPRQSACSQGFEPVSSWNGATGCGTNDLYSHRFEHLSDVNSMSFSLTPCFLWFHSSDLKVRAHSGLILFSTSSQALLLSSAPRQSCHGILSCNTSVQLLCRLWLVQLSSPCVLCCSGHSCCLWA